MIVIVGAGLAGLACATELHRHGKPFLLLDAGDTPGGRLRTSYRDGFTLDHGFQVVLSSYSAVSKVVDIPALKPRYFESGALLAHGGRLTHLANPLRHPQALVENLTSSAFSLRDKLLLGTLVTRVVMSSDAELLSRCKSTQDLSTQDFLRRFGFSALFVARFAEPFFGGVLLDSDLGTSAGLFLYYLKKFTTGRAWLPAGGIAALPSQMASSLPADSLRLRTRVISLDIKNDRACGVTLDNGERIAASSIVLALDEPSLCHLLGRPSPAPARSVAVVYFKSRQSLYPHSCLVLPESGNRRVRHFAQVTNVAPEFAPPGFHLISASVLDFSDLSDESLAHVVKKEIAALFPNTSHSLEYLETIRVPYAVPSQPPGFANRKPFPNLPAGVFTAGDWASGASIQSAISSGLDSAHSILNPLCP